MDNPHCLHDAPSATYEECFCGRCHIYGSFDNLVEEECPSDKKCFCKEYEERESDE
uniref:Uncharacterized protein n=1 Tax=viral metagenome TaxID=1070528 RepID=A0A6M3KMF3_9ZZZZ